MHSPYIPYLFLFILSKACCKLHSLKLYYVAWDLNMFITKALAIASVYYILGFFMYNVTHKQIQTKLLCALFP